MLAQPLRIAALFLLAHWSVHSYADTKGMEIIYTPIVDCKEQDENPNAAFSNLNCKKVGNASLRIEIQAPQFFNLYLTQGAATIRSEWDLLTKEGPMEPGKTLEWHLHNGEPKYLVFRISYQLDYSAPKQEVLTVNWVSKDRICLLATVNALKNPRANQQARDLISKNFAAIQSCPKDWLSF